MNYSPNPFSTVFRGASPFGIFFAVHLPDSLEIIPQREWNLLHKKEQEKSKIFKGLRKISYIGGRLAAKKALQSIQKEHLFIDMDPYGAPRLPKPLSVSISHKKDIAIALLAQQPNATIGIDIEEIEPERLRIATKILTQRELAFLHTLPEKRRWGFLLLNFSTKEAIFKALAPRLKRYIDFTEAEVFPTTYHSSDICLLLKEGSISPISISARYTWNDKYVITSVQAIWS